MVIRVTLHEVAEGETLESIGELYGAPGEAIKQLNGFRTDYPGAVGRRLMVPDMKGTDNDQD